LLKLNEYFKFLVFINRIKENLLLTAPTRKSGFGALLTGKYIFEMQLFAGISAVKIPPCV